MAIVEDELKNILIELRRISDHIHGSAIIDTRGQKLAEDLPKDYGRTLGAMVAAFLGVAQRMSQELMEKAPVQQSTFQTQRGMIIVYFINPQLLLAVLTDTEAPTGLVDYMINGNPNSICAKVNQMLVTPSAGHAT